jgi:RNA polymerase sigma-70 factor (ECF subfamily)
MTSSRCWHLELYLPYLRLLAKGLRIDPRLHFEASDVVMETFARAIKGLKGCTANTEAQLVAWLKRILVNTLNDMVDKAHTQREDVDRERSLQVAVDHSSMLVENILADNQPSPSEQVEKDERLRRLSEAIERLPEAQRTVIIERKLKGASMEEIATSLGRTKKAVADLLHRGVQKLKEYMQESERGTDDR